MKRKRFGFTLVEVLTVVVIIGILVSLLVPAVMMVKRMAREAQQKAQIATIETALLAFKNDYGRYPRSNHSFAPSAGDFYSGAQKLSEALLGRDLMGFHPASYWLVNHGTTQGVDPLYEPNNVDERKGPYLEQGTKNAFWLTELYPNQPVPNTYVLCDNFHVKIQQPTGESIGAGSPILYFKADESGKTIDVIYDIQHNRQLLELGKLKTTKPHPLADPTNGYENFYEFITDPKVSSMPWPYNPDSYLLISAGYDGLYGTADDITNFGD